ncbi:MAG: FAD-dependent oxidoreductase [Pirellulaceae bacterium]
MTVLNQKMLSCDLLVAGGGMSGVSAAVAAARRGANVVLCQDRSVLGGNASSEVRMHIVGADQSGGRGTALETEAREGGIVEEIRLENCVRNAQRSSSVFDLLLYELCVAEPNLTLLLNTTVTAANMGGDAIRSVIADRQSTEDQFIISAKVFIDATGDGRLGVEAGAPFLEGRESRDEFNEPLAQSAKDNMRLGSSIMFQAKKHDRPMPFRAPPWARKFTEEDLKFRPHGSNEDWHGDLGLEYGFWWIEWGGHLDTIKDNEAIRDELLAIVMGIWDHVKNGGNHGADNWALEWFGFLPGKRESRRFIGQYILTEHDITASTRFDDAIAYGGWYIDTHPIMGVDAPDEPPATQHQVPLLYDIPLRACISKTVRNLMFAGRNISATHIAFSSTRTMATCSVMGQGVGTAAAYAIAAGFGIDTLPTNPQAMREIQQQLLEDDSYLIGIVNSTSDDLAPAATITASSEQPEGSAANVTSGQTRSVHGTDGVAPGRTTHSTHRWMSDPLAGLPASITLEWPEPVAAKSVQLIFDTGMHRVMTLSLADTFTNKTMLWGQAPPETVRDYTIELQQDGVWNTRATLEGNYQRKRAHELSGEPFTALRVTATATNGLDHARICEIRVR